MKFLFFFTILTCSVSTYASPVLDCKMKQNACGMTGAAVTLPWATIPDATQYSYRQKIYGTFDIAYGYAQATGDYAAGNLIIREQDSQIGAYWGFVPNGESTYFAMIAGSIASGYKMGVKGCTDAPRVWSQSCRLTTSEAMQSEIYNVAGIGSPSTAPGTARAPGRHCSVEDVYQGGPRIDFTVDGKGMPLSVFVPGRRDGRDIINEDFLTPSTTKAGFYVGVNHGDFTSGVTVEPGTRYFWLHTTEASGGSRCL